VLIDAHTHAWPAQDLATLNQRLLLLDGGMDDADPHKWRLRHEGTIEALLEHEKAAGIDRFVILPIASKPNKVPVLNRWVADQARKHNEIIPFGTLVANSDRFQHDLQELIGLGHKGVKIHSFLQQLRMDSPEADDMFGAIADANLPIVLDSMNLQRISLAKPHLAPIMHTGLQFQTDTGTIHRLARRFPHLTIVAAHLGCLYAWDLLGPLYDLDNVYFDLSYVSGLLSPKKASEIIHRKGADRILFGTDAPWRSQQNVVAWFHKLDITVTERKRIAAENFLEITGA
jgi:uncharacterized protein